VPDLVDSVWFLWSFVTHGITEVGDGSGTAGVGWIGARRRSRRNRRRTRNRRSGRWLGWSSCEADYPPRHRDMSTVKFVPCPLTMSSTGRTRGAIGDLRPFQMSGFEGLRCIMSELIMSFLRPVTGDTTDLIGRAETIHLSRQASESRKSELRHERLLESRPARAMSLQDCPIHRESKAMGPGSVRVGPNVLVSGDNRTSGSGCGEGGLQPQGVGVFPDSVSPWSSVCSISKSAGSPGSSVGGTSAARSRPSSARSSRRIRL
jgi:hypothetical protein